jgi:hypothetical protein
VIQKLGEIGQDPKNILSNGYIYLIKIWMFRFEKNILFSMYMYAFDSFDIPYPSNPIPIPVPNPNPDS